MIEVQVAVRYKCVNAANRAKVAEQVRRTAQERLRIHLNERDFKYKVVLYQLHTTCSANIYYVAL